MKNTHASNGIAEDIIRSFVQIAGAELHLKTSIEKMTSEIETCVIDDEHVTEYVQQIEDVKEEVIELARIRREEMLYLFKLYGEKGNKDYWCVVKHNAMSMYTAWEAWQASDNDPELLDFALDLNKCLIKSITKFLGVEVTQCASCFTDILKAKENE